MGHYESRTVIDEAAVASCNMKCEANINRIEEKIQALELDLQHYATILDELNEKEKAFSQSAQYCYKIDEDTYDAGLNCTIKDYVDAVTTARQNNSDLITEYQGKQEVATNELSVERDNLVKEQNAKKECASITKVVSIWVEDAHEG